MARPKAKRYLTCSIFQKKKNDLLQNMNNYEENNIIKLFFTLKLLRDYEAYNAGSNPGLNAWKAACSLSK